MGGKLAILPELVWRNLLLLLEDSSDRLNVLQAFPELEPLLPQKKRYRWMFDQVLPYIFALLNQNDVLACRQVSQRWCSAVDNFLENHPTQNAYDHSTQALNLCQNWIPTASPKFYHLEDRFDKITFSNFEIMLRTFLQMNGHLESGKNPFVGRSIAIVPCNLNLELLRKFGEHFHFIEIFKDLLDEETNFWNYLLECLHLLLNLRRLRLVSCMDADNDLLVDNRNRVHQDSLQLPPLPSFESLEIWTRLPPNFLQSFSSTYSTQVRKLLMHFPTYGNFQPRNSFPNLTQLSIRCGNGKRDFAELLQNLDTPYLYSLQLKSDPGEGPVEVEELLSMLKRFPKLADLDLNEFKLPLAESGTLSPGSDSILSLKSLVIRDCPQLTYDFLLSLPSLQHLKIVASKTAAYSHFVKSEISSGNRLKFAEYILTRYLYESNVWELLPKLEGIALGPVDSEWKRYNRARWQHLKYENISAKLNWVPVLINGLILVMLMSFISDYIV